MQTIDSWQRATERESFFAHVAERLILEEVLPSRSIVFRSGRLRLASRAYFILNEKYKDWRISPGLTMSFGLRYENQTNIKDSLNFAPRLSFAWSPGAGGARAPKTVIRGGFGIFYDRFSENLTLQARRFNGSEQLSLLVSSFDPNPVRRAAAIALLQQAVFTVDGVSNAPTADQILAALPQSNTIRSISPEIQSPYMAQVALGVERQLPFNTTVSLFYIGSRTWHVLRARNINAPICP